MEDEFSIAGENEVLCSHSQSVDLHPQPKKKKNGPIEGNRSSPVWKHYNWVIDDEQLYAKCMYCGTKYKGDSRLGTTTAGRHTKGCEKYKEHLANNPVKIPEFDQKVYCRLFAEAIIKHSYPLIIVEHEGLRKVHYYLNNNVRAISRNTILKHCCNEHESCNVHYDHEKALATEKKTERVIDAELRKQQAMSHNSAEKEANIAEGGATTGTPEGGVGTTTTTTTDEPHYSHSSSGEAGHPTGAHQMSAMPGHGTGEPTGGHIVDGTQTGSHPIGKATGTNTTRSTTAQNRHAGGGTETGYAG